MCGRYSLGLPRHAIAQLYDDLDVDEWVDEEQFHPRHNIAPHSNAPVLRRADGPRNGTSSQNDPAESQEPPATRLIMQTMNWGLIPHWSRYRDNNLNTTNARAENLVEGGGMWSSIKGRKRCAVVCQGYFEWLKKGKERVPHFTKHKDGRLMLLAGMFDCVTLENESIPLWSFTIVTTSATSAFTWLHDRQPVILATRAQLDAWLDTSAQTWTPALSKLVEPYSDASNELAPLDCYAVPKEVGKVGTESSTFIEPVALRKDGIAAMFKKQERKTVGSTSSSPQSSTSKPTTENESRASPPAASASIQKTPSSAIKRKRESPEVLDLTGSGDEKLSTPCTPKAKKTKVGDVVKVSSPMKKTSPSKSPTKPMQSKRKAESAGESRTITQFFTKT